MSEVKKEIDYESKYKDALDMYNKMHIEIDEFENAYNLMNNEITMLEYEKEYLLDILCEIEDNLLRHDTLLKTKSLNIPTYKRPRNTTSRNATILESSEKILNLGPEYYAMKAHYDLIEQDKRKKYTDEAEELEAIINKWNTLTDSDKQNYRDMVGDKHLNLDTILEQSIGTSIKEDKTPLTPLSMSMHSEEEDMSSFPASPDPYSKSQHFEGSVSPTPQEDADISQVTSPSNSQDLNDSISSNKELSKLWNPKDKKFINYDPLPPSTLDTKIPISESMSTMITSKAMYSNPLQKSLRSNSIFLNTSVDSDNGIQHPKEGITYSRRPSEYDMSLKRKNSIVSINLNAMDQVKTKSSSPLEEEKDALMSDNSSPDTNHIHEKLLSNSKEVSEDPIISNPSSPYLYQDKKSIDQYPVFDLSDSQYEQIKREDLQHNENENKMNTNITNINTITATSASIIKKQEVTDMNTMSTVNIQSNTNENLSNKSLLTTSNNNKKNENVSINMNSSSIPSLTLSTTTTDDILNQSHNTESLPTIQSKTIDI